MRPSKKYNILLICGGGGPEHDISLITADFNYQALQNFDDVQVFFIEWTKSGERIDRKDQKPIELRRNGVLVKEGQEYQLHYAIPAIHGHPGEDGTIGAVFELMDLPYFGPSYEPSNMCFNKITTKLWLQSADIPQTPFLYISQAHELEKVRQWLASEGQLFIKASHQGSSIGCYPVKTEKELENAVQQAFKLSPYVLVEKLIRARELEIACYIYDGELIISGPGEIICNQGFYDFDEKYAPESQAKVTTRPELKLEIKQRMHNYARQAFELFKLSDLARVDFFLTEEDEVLLNEINTFPGMTTISLFPKLMQANGHHYSDFLHKLILKNALRPEGIK